MEESFSARILGEVIVAVRRHRPAREKLGQPADVGHLVVEIELARVRPRLIAVDHYLGLFAEIIGKDVFRLDYLYRAHGAQLDVNSVALVDLDKEVLAA